jgi:uncharacterized membrane protein YfcA
VHFAALFPHGFQYLGLALAAFLGGMVNAVAGGGGFLVFPSLLRVGVLPIQANATGTVGLWPGQITSIYAFRRDLRANARLLLPTGITGFIGGIGGALFLLHHSQNSFLCVVPYLFFAGAALFAVSGRISQWLRRRSSSQDDAPQRIMLLPMLAIQLPICFYIGYFGAGAGLLTMAALALCGVNRIAEINALKVVMTTIANGVAVITFIAYRAVEWRYCALMMLACAIGGYVGAHNSRRISDRVMRPVIVVFGFVVGAYFLFKHG